ncbi:FMN-binding protein [Candidatus Saccharibacteria bacterium]|nr:FMN-binding protein [Candidatus Saccharibacteria bacterium]
MKKTYIILITIIVFGAAAIVLYPSKKQEKVTVTKDTTQTSTTNATLPSESTTVSPPQSSLKDGQYNGTAESTPYGDVKIAIVVQSGKITNVNYLTMPNTDSHSAQLSQRASSSLTKQTITAQSANIDGVSGATYTSEAYITSLQAAIDAAKGV